MSTQGSIIVVSVEDLRKIIREELNAVLRQQPLASPPPQQEDIIGMEQACDMLGLAKPTIYGLVSHREIPHFKQGRKLRFRKSELEKWVEAGRRMTKVQLNSNSTSLLGKSKK